MLLVAHALIDSTLVMVLSSEDHDANQIDPHGVNQQWSNYVNSQNDPRPHTANLLNTWTYASTALEK